MSPHLHLLYPRLLVAVVWLGGRGSETVMSHDLIMGAGKRVAEAAGARRGMRIGSGNGRDATPHASTRLLHVSVPTFHSAPPAVVPAITLRLMAPPPASRLARHLCGRRDQRL
ncbi:hypothetical protein E2C01_004803 [Portunus trituberculatus]|uniref:Secreted protein n=1 Tax=Portunus trituberculatus TaxID=210409 RepID=A0A5B7CSB8_PORTR|nr:hypothetical protein [Portunus trituberculatus]